MTMNARNAHRRQRARALGICAECNDSPRDRREDGTTFAKCRDCRDMDSVRAVMRRTGRKPMPLERVAGIIGDFVDGMSLRAIAQKHRVCARTAKKLVC